MKLKVNNRENAMQLKIETKTDVAATLRNMNVGESAICHAADIGIMNARVTANRLKNEGKKYIINEESGSPTFMITRLK